MNRSVCKYLNPERYMRRFVALANQHVLGYLESVLAPSLDSSLRHPPIFVVGAPRSGSTLMIQVITDALDVGYISNRHCQWYGAPVLAERLFQPTRTKPLSDYRSGYGATEGPYAPAECGQWWYRFFRRDPPYVTVDEVEPKKMHALRRSVAALTAAFDQPLLFKNLYASLRIQALAQYLPESLFIVTHRDEVDNGHSLLEARYRRFKDYAPWFSVEPPETDVLKELPPDKQVIEQIRHIHATIERDLDSSGVPGSRRFDLCYEGFCADPRGSVDAVRSFLISNGCKVGWKREVPQKFERRNGVRIDHDLYAAMVAYAQGPR